MKINEGKICIAKSNEFSFSETFLDNQINKIKPDYVLFGGWMPMIAAPGGTIFKGPLSVNLIRGGVKNLMPKLYEKLYTKYLAMFFAQKDIRIVLANYGIIGVNILKACQEAKVKLVVHFHGFDTSEKSILKAYAERYKVLFNYAENIIAVSNQMAEKLIELGALRENVSIIPCGINTELFSGASPLTAKKNIYFVGRFTAKKAPDKLLLSFSLVVKKHPDAMLHLIGEGELLDETVSLAHKLGLSKNVVFHGKQKPEFVISELRKAKIFIQHSVVAPSGDSEGTPNTVLEASSIGLPVVSTKHAGINQAVIDGQTGYLVDEHDWQSMGEKINLLLSNDLLCQEMGKAGRIHIMQNYNLNLQTDKIKAILNQ